VDLKEAEYKNVYWKEKIKKRVKSWHFATFGFHDSPERF
jgi:hypothetical protein